jgi:hypothetical protein
LNPDGVFAAKAGVGRLLFRVTIGRRINRKGARIRQEPRGQQVQVQRYKQKEKYLQKIAKVAQNHSIKTYLFFSIF